MKRNPDSEADKGLSHDTVLSASLLEKALASGALPAKGELSPSGLIRLAGSVEKIAAPICWRFEPDAQGPSLGRPRRRWWLSVDAQLVCKCERCLGPVELMVQARRGFEFFESAAVADARTAQITQDDELDDPDLADLDFLSPDDGATISGLVEDEILLNLPLAPKHADCSPPPVHSASPSGRAEAPDPKEEEGKTRPFAGLRDLLKKT